MYLSQYWVAAGRGTSSYLVVEDRDERSDQEQNRAKHKGAVYGHILYERQRPLECKKDETHNHREDLEDGRFDDDGYEERSAFRGSVTANKYISNLSDR